MIENRANCENCNKALPPESTEAMMCAFECTFCKSCVDEILQNVCPNCGGGFEKRPILPKQYRAKYPAPTTSIYKPVDMDTFSTLLDNNKDIKPADR